MCKVFYTDLKSCSRSSPCRFHSGNIIYCNGYACKHAKDEWHRGPDYLIVAEKDKYGNFKATDEGTIFRTKGESPDKEVRRFYCEDVVLEKSNKSLAEVCPYHRPDGLKEKWDTVGKQQWDAEKRKEAEKAQREEYEEERKRRHRNGCVMQ